MICTRALASCARSRDIACQRPALRRTWMPDARVRISAFAIETPDGSTDFSFSGFICVAAGFRSLLFIAFLRCHSLNRILTLGSVAGGKLAGGGRRYRRSFSWGSLGRKPRSKAASSTRMMSRRDKVYLSGRSVTVPSTGNALSLRHSQRGSPVL